MRGVKAQCSFSSKVLLQLLWLPLGPPAARGVCAYHAEDNAGPVPSIIVRGGGKNCEGGSGEHSRGALCHF